MSAAIQPKSDEKIHGDVGTWKQGRVQMVEIRRPPNNFFDTDLINWIADAYDDADADDEIRAVVLCAAGKHFCSGADFARRAISETTSGRGGQHLYKHASRMMSNKKPVVAAIQGAAIGGGLGVAMTADFRVTCEEARFSANFTRMSYHPGFGLTCTLPRLVGAQQAALLFYTGRRVTGDEAVRLGMAEQLVPLAEVRNAAIAMAEDIAGSGPLALVSTRATMRRGLVDAFETATERELTEQDWMTRTADFKEGTKAMGERRAPVFTGK